MSLEARVVSLAQAIGDDIQILLAQDGSLTALNTTDKTSLVAAINEVITLIAGAGGGDLLAANNLSELANAATARTNLDVRSTTQVTSEISAAIAAISLASLGGLDQTEVDARVQLVVGAAPAALDTLTELAAALGNDANFAGTITTALGNKIDFASVQTLSLPQQLQACQNIGVGNNERDFTADYITARDS